MPLCRSNGTKRLFRRCVVIVNMDSYIFDYGEHPGEFNFLHLKRLIRKLAKDIEHNNKII